MGRLVLGTALAFLLVRPTPVQACSAPGLTPHVLDPAIAATDQVAPTLPTPVVTSINRGQGPKRSGCGWSGSSCDDLGSIAITNLATDNVTPADRIGYRFAVVGGRLPSGFSLPGETVNIFISGGTLWLNWIDGATDDQEAIDFSLQIIAVDSAGNESAPQIVRVHDEAGGCRIAPAGSSWVGSDTVFLLAVLLSSSCSRRPAAIFRRVPRKRQR
jgi:hypothetical protein